MKPTLSLTTFAAGVLAVPAAVVLLVFVGPVPAVALVVAVAAGAAALIYGDAKDSTALRGAAGLINTGVLVAIGSLLFMSVGPLS